MEETQDIVAWLRDREANGREINHCTAALFKRAADEIERLRGLVPRIVAAERDAARGLVGVWRRWAADISPWVLGESDEKHRQRITAERDDLRARAERAEVEVERLNKIDRAIGSEFEALLRGRAEAAEAEVEEWDRWGGLVVGPRESGAAMRAALDVHLRQAAAEKEYVDALDAWRKWAVKVSGVDETYAQDLDDDALRVEAADYIEAEAKSWRRAHETSDADLRAARAQRDFYRARLHAEIEAHSIRAAKEKP